MATDPNSQKGVAADPLAIRAEHQIEIQAPAETVWSILSDLQGWARWNPCYTPPVCIPKVGETVSATVTMPGAPPAPFSAEIIAWEPNKRFSWHSEVMDGQMQMTRYMEIEPIDAKSCRFINGEAFGGTLGPTIMKDLVGGIQEGFQVMSEALKQSAEPPDLPAFRPDPRLRQNTKAPLRASPPASVTNNGELQ